MTTTNRASHPATDPATEPATAPDATHPGAAAPAPDPTTSGSAQVTRAIHAAYPGLDGLRALAVAAVVTTHVAFTTGRYMRGFGNNLMARMDSGVAIFFVLSGFLLVRPWLAAAVRGGERPPALGTYAVRRVARIMPAYLVAIAAALLLLPENAGAGAWDWVRHIANVQIYHPGWLRAGLTQCWSLATEVAFYAVLPLIGAVLIALSRRRWRPGLLLGVIGLGVLVAAPWYWLIESGPGRAWLVGGFWLPGYLGWFCGGMAMAVIRTHLDRRPPEPGSRWWLAEQLGAHPLTCWALALGTYFIAMTPLAGPRSIQATTAEASVTKHLLYLAFALALVWPAVFGHSRVAQAVLANRTVRYLGDISYGVFLYHLVVLEGVMRLLDNDLWTGRVIDVLPLTLIGSGVAAALSYRLLERPIIERAHRGRSAPRHRPATAAASTSRHRD